MKFNRLCVSLNFLFIHLFFNECLSLVGRSEIQAMGSTFECSTVLQLCPPVVMVTFRAWILKKSLTQLYHFVYAKPYIRITVFLSKDMMYFYYLLTGFSASF